MNVFEIRQMPKIFGSHTQYFGYDYHLDPRNKKKIYLEYNIYMEAQYLRSYELKEDKGVFMLIFSERVDVGFSGRPSEPECEVAGRTEAEAVDFMIKKILEGPAGHKDAKVNVGKLEASLRLALSEKAA